MRLLPPLLLFSFCVVPNVKTYKILVYNPQFGHSHSNFMGRIADVLVEAGHNVTALIPLMDKNIAYGTKKANIVFMPQDPEAERQFAFINSFHSDYFSLEILNPIGIFIVGRLFASVAVAQCKSNIRQTEIIEQLTEEHFDVMLTENFDMCGMGLSHLIKPKSVIMTCTSFIFGDQHEEIGVPQSLSFNPAEHTSYLNVHSTWSRLKNIYAGWLFRKFFSYIRSDTHQAFREEHGQDFPSFEELTSHSAYAFTNSEPLIDIAYPTLNRVIPIGGIGAKEPQPLDEYWSSVLSLRDRAVLISFGSVAKSQNMTIEAKRSLVQMISAFPNVTFIWKYENTVDDFVVNEAAKQENLVLATWTPQNDLLSDERLVVFLTHAGMGSVQETALRGVPGLFVPLFGDQPRNAAMMQHNQLGKVYDKFELDNAEKLTAAMRELLEDEKYLSNARRISRMLSKQPFSARERLVKHVEFAAEFGPSSSLRPQSHDMNTIEYYNLDIIAILGILSGIVLYIVAKLSIWVVTKIFSIRVEKAKQA